MTSLLSVRLRSLIICIAVNMLIFFIEGLWVFPIASSLIGTLSVCKDYGIVTSLESWTSDKTRNFYIADSDLSVYSDGYRLKGKIIIINNDISFPIIHLSRYNEKKYNISNSSTIEYMFGDVSGELELGNSIESLSLFSNNSSIFNHDLIIIEGLEEYIDSAPRSSYDLYNKGELRVAWGNSTITTLESYLFKHFCIGALYFIFKFFLIRFVFQVFEKVGIIDIGSYYRRLWRIGLPIKRVYWHYIFDTFLVCLIPFIVVISNSIFFSIKPCAIIVFSLLNFIFIFWNLKRLRRVYPNDSN